MKTPALPRAKLPFWRTVVDAYRLVIFNAGQVARLSWLWLLIFAAVATALAFSVNPRIER